MQLQFKIDLTKARVPGFIKAGFGVSITFTIVWILAAALNGQWIFGWNALSDLGVCKTEASVIIFNYGCVLTGLCGCFFGYGILRHEKNWLFLMGLLTMVGCVFLMGVGAIPEDHLTPHCFCAGMFGAMCVVAMAMSAAGDYANGRYWYSIIALVLLGTCAIVQSTGFGFFEAVSIICILVWVATQAYKYYKIIGAVPNEDPLAELFENSRLHNKLTKKE